MTAVARALAKAAADGRAVRFEGGATKLDWGTAATGAESLAIGGANGGAPAIREHNAGDLTAVVEAGLPLVELQTAIGEAGQMLALDPPLGSGEGATLGGVVATNDSGPLRHRYGSARDLVVGMTVALSDGTVARSGGKVIKNVAGYDLAKLFTGSYGTLGAILELVVRLHPLPPATVTARGAGGHPSAIAAAAAELGHARIELQSLDVSWGGGAGAVLARFGGSAPLSPARDAAAVLERNGLEAQLLDGGDDAAWDEQRAAQRSRDTTVVRVSGLPGRLAGALAATERLGGTLVGRAGLGLWWITLPAGSDGAAAVKELRRALAPSPCVVLDAAPEVRAAVDVWGPQDPAALGLMRRVKERFDPAGACAPGIFAGGI